MTKLLIATSMVALVSTPALAIDFNNGLALTNTIEANYSIEAEDFTAGYTAKLGYVVTEGLVAYATTGIDLRDPAFTGLDLGVEYSPAQLSSATLTAEAQFDENLDYSDVVLGLKLEF